MAEQLIPYGKWHPVAVRWGTINSYTGPLTFYIAIVIAGVLGQMPFPVVQQIVCER